MSSYHSSFGYLGKNSSDEGFRIAAFESDNGEYDTFLSMDQVYTDSNDGTRRNLYGLKYNAVATINITIIKKDGSDLSVADNRRALRWLTGRRQASWLDFYENDTIVYSFLGSVIDVKQQKMDARVVGLIITFESLHPWAYSTVQPLDTDVGQAMLELNNDRSIYKGGEAPYLNIDENGVLYNDDENEHSIFNDTVEGVIYNDSSVRLLVDNQTDDLYSYINLDMVYHNINSDILTIYNTTLNEESNITGINDNEVISLSSGQFIVSHQYTEIVDGINQYTNGIFYINDENLYREINLPESYADIFVKEFIGDGETMEFSGIDSNNKDLIVQINGKINHSWSYEKESGTISFSYIPKENDKIEVFHKIYNLKQNTNKIFGDTFNFKWPRLAPGENVIIIDGLGKGTIKFSYRYPIKIGDCAVDIANIIDKECNMMS